MPLQRGITALPSHVACLSLLTRKPGPGSKHTGLSPFPYFPIHGELPSFSLNLYIQLNPHPSSQFS